MSRTGTSLSADDAALVSTIYDPPRARRRWSFRDVLPQAHVTYYSLARWALVDALKCCGVAAGDRVLLPGLICRDVIASLSVLGATPTFYSVSPRLAAAGLDDSPAAKAVLAVNYFGFPQDLAPFRRFCARTGAVLIEDNAHGLFSKDEDGCLLGGRGDAGIFSFRKTVAVSEGAALVLGEGREPPLPTGTRHAGSARVRHDMKRVVRSLVGRVNPAHALNAVSTIRALRESLTGDALLSSAPDAETRIPLPADPIAAILGAVSAGDPEMESQRRRDLYRLVARVLQPTPASPLFSQVPPHVTPYGFPFFAAPAHVAAIVERLSRHGMSLLGWPDLPAAISPSAPDHYRHLMVVPFLW